MEKQQVERTLPTLQPLPDLPKKLYLTQCISYLHSNNEEELLICGGLHNNNCYSYHIQKQQYKFICSYPKNIQLCGHTVISYPASYSSNSSNSSNSSKNHQYRDRNSIANNNNI